ncbi:hypothetical protein K438DRAFT_1945368 [Mycena galopus ATCC 62051]|nr:hypothetical protein K438DRAFT_1945368 [Mycena galopus ATCC 62051]
MLARPLESLVLEKETARRIWAAKYSRYWLPAVYPTRRRGRGKRRTRERALVACPLEGASCERILSWVRRRIAESDDRRGKCLRDEEEESSEHVRARDGVQSWREVVYDEGLTCPFRRMEPSPVTIPLTIAAKLDGKISPEDMHIAPVYDASTPHHLNDIERLEECCSVLQRQTKERSAGLEAVGTARVEEVRIWPYRNTVYGRITGVNGRCQKSSSADGSRDTPDATCTTHHATHPRDVRHIFNMYDTSR